MLRTILHRLPFALPGAGAAALVLVAIGGAANGGNFILGQANTATATTSLSGSTAGPQLKVVNTNTSNHTILSQAGGGSGIALYGQHTTTTGAGPALRSDSASTAAGAFSIYGQLSSTTPGSPSAAIRAESKSTNANGYGLWASQAGSGSGVYATSPSGTGVLGKHTGSAGVGAGVEGDSASAANAGVIGKNTAGGPGLQAIVNSNAVAPLKVNSTAKVANLNADLLDGLDSTALPYWKLGGNTGTTPGTNFLGTTDNQALELKVNGQRALRLEPDPSSPNVIGGHSGNGPYLLNGTFGMTIAGGGTSDEPNRVTDNFGTVGGGVGNIAGDVVGEPSSAAGATVAGGTENNANGYRSTVGGGLANVAAGYFSTVPGGLLNGAIGDFSFAARKQARANHAGAFVWGDSTAPIGTNLNSPATDTFTVRASGGIWLGKTGFTPVTDVNKFIITTAGENDNLSLPGAYLSNAGVWTDVSDRASKHAFRRLDKSSVLQKVDRIPIGSWSYKAEPPAVRHIGPTAQDFYAAFGLGLDNKHIGTIDEAGVALAAIQGLYRQNKALEHENIILRAQLSGQNTRLTKLEHAFSAISR
jgi:Chaperone of endosialidase